MVELRHWLRCIWKARGNMTEARRGYLYEKLTGFGYWKVK